MDSSEKKLVTGIFNFREVLRPFLEPRRSASFPGASLMIREISHVCISQMKAGKAPGPSGIVVEIEQLVTWAPL